MNPRCVCVSEWRLVTIDGRQRWRRFLVDVSPECSWAHEGETRRPDVCGR